MRAEDKTALPLFSDMPRAAARNHCTLTLANVLAPFTNRLTGRIE